MVEGLGFRIQCSKVVEFQVLGFMVEGLGFRIQGSKVVEFQGLGFMVYGFGMKCPPSPRFKLCVRADPQMNRARKLS